MRNNKGISLIVLVITIIVIMILAGTVVLALSNNNPINAATEATFKSKLDSYNSEINAKISSKYLEDYTINPININATIWDGNPDNITDTIKEYIPSINVTDGLNYIIKQGKLLYIGNEINETKWLSDLGISNSYKKNGLVICYDGKYFTNSPQTTSWNDLSENNYNGIPTNFSYTTDSGSNNIGGVVFDGVDDYINTNTGYNFINNFSNNEYTLEVDLTKGQYINSGEVSTYGETIIAASAAAPYFMWLTIKGSEVAINTFSSSATAFNLTTGANITEGGNYVIQVVVKKGNLSKIFVNGILKGTFTADISNITSIGYFTIADLRINRNIRFSGSINSLRIYNRVLSDVEILQNYNAVAQ